MSDAAQSSVSAMTKKPSLIEWIVLGVVVFGASLAAKVFLAAPWDRAGLVLGFPVAWFLAQLVARRPLDLPMALARYRGQAPTR